MPRKPPATKDDRTCATCGKVLKTPRGRTLHERTCRGPAAPDGEAGLEPLPLPPSEEPIQWDTPPPAALGRMEPGPLEDASPLPAMGRTDRRQELLRQIEVLDDKAASITSSLGEFTARAMAQFEDLQDELEARALISDVRRMQDRLAKIEGKLEELMEETGHGVVMDIGKIPPHILESVYQSTLDDLLAELRKTFGPHDAERLVEAAKEEVRAKTSGSELFHFEPPHLRVRGLAKTVEKGLISARQIHSTYEEFLRVLREPIPGYRPKNFRAMLKVKSQEFAVDRSTSLTDNLGDLTALVRDAVDRTEAARAEMEERLAAFSAEIAALREDLGAVEALTERVQALEERMRAAEERAPREVPLEERLLERLPAKGFTAKRAARELGEGVSEEAVAETLERLAAAGRVTTEARGRWTVYVPAERVSAPPETPPAPRLEVDALDAGPRAVYDAIGRDGRTLNALRSLVGDEMKYTDLLKALRILLDGGLLTTTERGRHTVYLRTTQKEVTNDA